MVEVALVDGIETEIVDLLAVAEELVFDERLDVVLPNPSHFLVVDALFHEVARPEQEVRSA